MTILQKTLQSMLLGGDAGESGRGDHKELGVVFVLLDGGIYCTLAMLSILTFDF